MPAMAFNFAFSQKENKSFKPVNIKAKVRVNKYAH